MESTGYVFCEIPDTLVDKVYKFLSGNNYDGIHFFEECFLKYNTISPIIVNEPDGGFIPPIPYVVHFREGMQVRNFMRDCEECKNWNDNEFDDNWTNVVKKCLYKHYQIVIKKLEENDESIRNP